jgi:uncharacterized membrane protein YsdA (DUF1294 family)
MDILIYYLLIINALAFLLMLTDKRRARKNAWRIPEATLLGVAALGGSLGAVMGMRLFRHKTLHPKFSIGLPLMLAVHIILLVLILIKAA